MGDMAEYYDSRGDDRAERDILEWHQAQRASAVDLKKQKYVAAEAAKIGTNIACPNCSRLIVKRTYNRRFCGTRCKDKFWNSTDPIRAARAARYSR